ncbi:MAG: YraN family protein [Anaerolineales bacterium]
MAHNQKIGRWGEEMAAAYLQERGYEIVEKNARTPCGEIDLVARRDGLTVFVEVKTRTSRRFGLPEEAITPRKQAHMLAAAEHYAAEHEIDSWQADVLAVEGQPGKTPSIEHFENVLS